MKFERILERGRERLRPLRPPGPRAVHLDEALGWLRAAQDATDDDGVSHSYLIGERWMRSYPETTGYIVPTLLNAARAGHGEDLAERALRMAAWELANQREDGAIPDLQSNAPVIFDTGQVIFGWVAAHRETGEDRFLDAARRGADWIVGRQDEDGAFRHEADSGGPGRVYNARTAWALLVLGRALGSDAYDAPARRFLDWTLAQERGEGSFDRNCLTDDAAPLLHTIAYTARGQLESAALLGETSFLEAAARTAGQVLLRVGPDGRVAGRFDAAWHPTVSWCCLTGMAQMAIVWRLLALRGGHGLSGDALRGGAERVERFLLLRQDRSSNQPGLRGGIRGSWPVTGAYGQWRVLNWATKFFADALLLAEDDEALHHAG